MAAPPPEIDAAAIVRHPLAAALAGSLIGLRFAPGASWAARAFNAGSSVALAAVFGPLGAELMGLSPVGESALAGGVALFGLGLVDQLQAGLKAVDAGAVLAAWLPWLKGPKGPTKGE